MLSEKNLGTEGQILYDAIYMRYLEQLKSERQKEEWGLPVAGELGFDGCRVSTGEDEQFWRWMVVTVAQQCKCTLKIS